LRKKPKQLGLVGRGAHLGEGDVLEDVGHHVVVVDGGALGDRLERAPEHVEVAAAAGEQADAHLDEARVGLRRGLHGVAGQADLEAAAERHSVGRGDDRDGRVLHALDHVLEALDHRADRVPVLVACGHGHDEEVGAHAEVLALVGDEHGAEVLLGALDREAEDARRVGVDAVGLGLEGHAEHAVAEIPGLGAVVAEHRRAPRRRIWSVALRGSAARVRYSPFWRSKTAPSAR
jgi:hypothetical protein